MFSIVRRSCHIIKPVIAASTLRTQRRGISVAELKTRIANMTSQPPKHEMVAFESLYSQLVAMEIPVGGDIGDEVHTVDQILLFTSGTCRATVSGKDRDVTAGDVVVVPAGTQHQFVNTGNSPLELITVYSPAEHDSKTVHKTKEEGDKEEDEGRDEPPKWSQQTKEENEKQGLANESAKY